MRTFHIHLLILAALTLSACQAPQQSVRFLATGDTPYSAGQVSQYRALLAQSAAESFDFLVHVGDIKGADEPCTDERFEVTRDIFAEQKIPVVYTPGDNEWTDCYVEAAGARDPVERLAALRRIFFEDESALRLDELGVQRQSEVEEYSRYLENYTFHRGGVLFIVVHVAGTANGSLNADPRAQQEHRERIAANRAFLEDSFRLAASDNVAAVAIIIHANPDFEKRGSPGHHSFLNTLEAFLRDYSRPVVCIHGDSHRHRIDKPFLDPRTGKPFENFTRMEVFGHPDVAGVVVEIDASATEVFSFEPYHLSEPVSAN